LAAASRRSDRIHYATSADCGLSTSRKGRCGRVISTRCRSWGTVAASQRGSGAVREKLPQGLIWTLLSSKWRDLDNRPGSLTQGGNHEPNRSSLSARAN
jgi:hypothetical protein